MYIIKRVKNGMHMVGNPSNALNIHNIILNQFKFNFVELTKMKL